MSICKNVSDMSMLTINPVMLTLKCNHMHQSLLLSVTITIFKYSVIDLDPRHSPVDLYNTLSRHHFSFARYDTFLRPLSTDISAPEQPNATRLRISASFVNNIVQQPISDTDFIVTASIHWPFWCSLHKRGRPQTAYLEMTNVIFLPETVGVWG